VTGDYDGGGRGSASGGDVGTHEHAGAELVEDALGFGLAGSCGLALETADGETLLGDGVSDVGGVLQRANWTTPMIKTNNNGAASTSSAETEPRSSPLRARHQRRLRGALACSASAPPSRRSVPVLMLFAVVSTLEAMTATAPMASATNKAVMTTVSVE